jgi:hypothetical protein
MDTNFMLIIYYKNYTPCLLPVYVGTIFLILPENLSSSPILSGFGFLNL